MPTPWVLDCRQGSDAWIQARLGVPTASEFERIITAKTGKLSAMRRRYRAELVAEWVQKEPYFQYESEEMARGKELEPEAFEVYGAIRDIEPAPAGFVYRDGTFMAGASPDGFAGDFGLIEMKAPMLKTHLVYLDEGALPEQYICQVQGQLWVTGREWVDFFSYHPGYPHFLVRVLPNPDYQRALDMHMPAFISEILSARERMVDLGVPITEIYVPKLAGQSDNMRTDYDDQDRKYDPRYAQV